MAYVATLTNLGESKISAAFISDGQITLTTGQVGDGGGNPTTPSVTDTELVNSVFSATLNRVYVDPQDERRIVAELILPASEGGWAIREVGIFDSDGDMIAISQFPEVYKPTAAEGATMDLVIRVFLIVSVTSVINLEADTSVIIATRSWVTNNFGMIPGGTTDQVLTKTSNADGAYEWQDPQDVTVIVGVVTEEQTLIAAQTTVTLVTCTTEGASIYIEGIRLHPGDWTATDATTITLAQSYPAGYKIFIAQNEPTGGAEYLRRERNLADLPDKSIARANLELLTNETYLEALWKLMNQRQYPVGEIYTTRRAGNPSTLLGFGTWEAYAAGRVLVGHDAGDVAFNEVDKTGGAKTHTLSVGEIPAHTHTTGTTNLTTGYNSSNGTNTVPANGTTRITNNTGSTGGGAPHNNLQPYITVFMWKRTA